MNTRKRKLLVLLPIATVVVVLSVTLLSRSSGQDTTNSEATIPSSKQTEMVTLQNGDSYDITARPVKHTVNGQEVQMLAYNDSIPGPTIIVNEGDEITLNIQNELDVPTTIHPHGINAESENDGVPNISQDPIEIGEAYQQKVRFPEPGLFWYHPHVREDYTQASGLYANFIVRPKDSSNWPTADSEEILQMSDIALTENGLLPFDKDEVTHTVMGRFGDTQLINGVTDYRLSATQGSVTRLYLTNTSSVRSYRFEIPGVQMKLIGGDNGLYEQETFVDTVTVAPSERAIVDVLFDKSGEFTIQNNNPEANTTIGYISVQPSSETTQSAQDFSTLASHEDVTQEIEELINSVDETLNKRIATKVDMDPLFMQSMADEMELLQAREAAGDHSPIEWEDEMPDGNSRSNTENTQWSLQDLDNLSAEHLEWSFKQDDVVRITVTNSDQIMHPMQHPIHMHGQKFIVASINGEPTKNRVFKDVVQVPIGDTYELIVRMENPGTWLMHCHIPEHMESGMVGTITVGDTQVPEAESATPQTQVSQQGANRHVDTSSELYMQFESVPEDGYSEFFIANMIHFSEGIAQLEQLVLDKSTNQTLRSTSTAQAAKATGEISSYKQLQKELGFPISYGNNMLYHGGMGADAEVFYSLQSLNGLDGAQFETAIVEQLIYFRELESITASIGLTKNIQDEQVTKLMDETLNYNATILDTLKSL